jgi:hypothetical protein
MIPVYGWKCLSRKVVHSCIEKFSQGRSKVTDVARPRVDVAETTVERLLCCGFQITDQVMGQLYVLSMFEYHLFYGLYPFVTYLLTLPHNYEKNRLYVVFSNSLLCNCPH